MRVLVTGASGLLGLNMCLRLSRDHDVHGLVNTHTLSRVPFSVTVVDLMDIETAFKNFSRIKPDVFVNCAAMADVDKCEKNPSDAWTINTAVPGEIAEYCGKNGILFVQISTDAVFDGKKGNYSEDDEPNPLSVYAQTKLQGEENVLSVNPSALVPRVNFYGYSLSGKRSLSEFFLNSLTGGNTVKGFVDVMFCPLYVLDLVDIIFKMLEKKLKGIYHTVSKECTSKYSFGLAIADKFGLQKDLIEPISVHKSDLVAKRSPRLTLNVDKLLQADIKLPGQEEGLDSFYRDFQQQYPEQIRLYSDSN